MSGPLRHPLLEGAGIEHGFGVRGAVAPAGVRRPVQVHGARVVADTECAGPSPARADAVVSTREGVIVGVITADCVPVLAATADGRGVAAIHAGWRGLAQGVIEAGIGELAARGSGEPILAVIGPHIGPCCYEVDDPVLAALGERYADALRTALHPTRPGHARLDLGHLARRALVAAGVEDEAIGVVAGVCTACDAQRFHSYRREGPKAGRLLHHVRVAQA